MTHIVMFAQSLTQEVQDYILFWNHHNTEYEIHLFDSPGFDDGTMQDTEILAKVADFVNFNYRLKKTLAGVLYLHDITKAKPSTVAKKNLRMLEEMLGVEKWNNCMLLTTRWGCTNRVDEEAREQALKKNDDYFGLMLNNVHKARIERFDPMNKARAMVIIEPFLRNNFVTKMSEQMADHGMALGETGAGRVVADGLQELAKKEQDLAKVNAAKEILARKFDESLFLEFKEKRKKLRQKAKAQQTTRWMIRTTIVGGAIPATILTLGPGASAFVLEPAYEKIARTQKKSEKEARLQLEKEFRQKSALAHTLHTKDSKWLWDKKVKKLSDLDDDRYSLMSRSSDDLGVARHGAHIGRASSAAEHSQTSMIDSASIVTGSSTDTETPSERGNKDRL